MGLYRSLLFVPATTPERIPKALAAGADAVIVDLEDAVDPDRKDEARRAVSEFLENRPASSSPPLWVRVNGSQSPWLEKDLDTVVMPGLAGVVLPKTQDPAEVRALERKTADLSKRRKCAPPVLVPAIESALGLLRAFDIAASSPRCAALALGGEDLARDIGALRTSGREALEWARGQLVVTARAAGLLPVDTVYIDFHDDGGLRREAERARAMGFAGKLVIHPRQVATVNRVFTPSPEELQEARAVVAAFEEARRRGEAVAVLNGRMLDPPVVEQARRILGSADGEFRMRMSP